jgi:hypothetical protein
MGNLRILYWFDAIRDAKCSLPHDRVFSLLGLAEEGLQIPVDYDVSLIELTVHIFRVTKQGLCLCEALLMNYVLQIDPAAFDRTNPGLTVEWQFSRHVEELVRACPEYHHARTWSWDKWHPIFPHRQTQNVDNNTTLTMRIPFSELFCSSKPSVATCRHAASGRPSTQIRLAYRFVDWGLDDQVTLRSSVQESSS